MQITIFGASGKVGQLAVAEALVRGYSVTAFVHSHDPFQPHPQLTVYKGDVYNPQDIAAALQGSEAVLSCLGSWGTPKKDVLVTAMRAIVPVMEQGGIKRIVTLTGNGALSPDKTPSTGHKLFLRMLDVTPAGKVFRDGEQHMRILQQSKLTWTTVRSPVMNNQGNTSYKLSLNTGLPWATINRKAVAFSMLDQLQDAAWHNAAPIIVRKF